MTRFNLFLLASLLGLPGHAQAQAQNSAAPANVVTPAPPPRAGTVGPEQLRDFALPGTRESPPSAEVQRPAPAPAARTASPATTSTTAPATAAPARPVPRAEPAATAVERAAPEGPREADSRPTQAELPPSITPAAPVPVAVPEIGEPLPPITVTPSSNQASGLLPAWWPWLLVALAAGIGLALVRHQRRRPVVAGVPAEALERAAPEPAVPVRTPPPPPVPAPPAPALPTGLVTTRLRQPSTPPPAPAPAAVPQPVSGGVVSSRLRGWLAIELLVREVLLDAEEARLRIDLVISNGGSGLARDIALEALTLNGGEQQGAEIATFFARPAAPSVALPEIGPLSDVTISHELRMPRSAIRAYEVQGRTLFVPVIAVNAAYRTASGEGRTGAAFLVGRDVPGSEKLAPLLLPPEAGRLLGLGVRRLEEAVRR